jgi:hypothetical protein
MESKDVDIGAGRDPSKTLVLGRPVAARKNVVETAIKSPKTVS